MVAPLVLAGAGLAGAGLAGSLFGKKKVPKINLGNVNSIIGQASEREQRLIGGLRPQTSQLTDQFGTSIDEAQANAAEARRGSAQDFLQNYDPITSELVSRRTDSLRRSSAQAAQDRNQQLREGFAGGTGLGGAAYADALARSGQETARTLGEGIQDIEQQALQGQLAAREKVFNVENQAILSDLGIDTGTAETILNTGNQALINELNALIDESRNTSGLRINADLTAQGANIAAAQNAANNRQAFFNQLTGIGGSLLGAGLSSPSSNASTLTPQQQNEALQAQRLRMSGALRSR